MAESILYTVKDLLSKEYSICSSTEGDSLRGKLEIVLEDNENDDPKGTVLLVDSRTRQSIHCNVDVVRSDILNIQVIITCWNYIYCEASNTQYLEFQLKDVYRLKANENTSILDECLEFDHFDFEDSLEQDTKLYLPENDILLSENAGINIVGKIVNISIIYNLLDLPSAFFIQLAAKESSVASMTVMFRGNDLIEYYRSFLIDCIYAFHNIRLSSAFDTKDRHKKVFEYDNKHSSVQMITLQQYQKAVLTAPPVTSFAQRVGHSNTTKIVRIVRVIDTILGIYEVNNGDILYLFDSPKYTPTRPFRTSTTLRLDYIHEVSVKSNNEYGSSLFESLWEANRQQYPDGSIGYNVIAACSRSHLQVLSFPDHCDTLQTIHQWLTADSLIEIYKSMFHLHLPDVLRLLELYAPLFKNFSDMPELLEAVQTLRQRFKELNNKPARSSIRSSITRFLNNDCDCATISYSDDQLRDTTATEDIIYINTCPTLSTAIRHITQNAQELDASKAIGASTKFEIANVSTLTVEYNEGFDHAILGIILTLEDGKTYFSDNKTRFPLLITGILDIPIYDGLYLLKRLHWFKEDLSCTKAETKIPLFFEYLSCSVHDLFLVHGSNNHKLTFSCSSILNPNSVSHFSVSQNGQVSLQDDIYHILYVTAVYPTEIISVYTGHTCLNSRVEAMLYSIGNGDIGKTKVELILNSDKGGLKYKNVLRLSRWCVIKGLVNAEVQELDKAEHTIYPIHVKANMDSTKPNHIVLHYVQLNTGVYCPPDSIFSISDLIFANVDSRTPGNGQDRASNNMVNISGIVVTKCFTQGYGKSPDDSHDTTLFKQFGIGTGKHNRKLYVRLRQPNSLETVDIYLELKDVEYPVGLVLGASVIFRNLMRKQNVDPSVKLYCINSEQTTIEIQSTEPLDEPSVTSLYPSMQTISKLYSEMSDSAKLSILRILCSVKSFHFLCLEVKCINCKSFVRKGECIKSCVDSQKKIIASASVEVCDGTGVAQVYIDGERLVFSLLQLTLIQKEKLKEIALQYGKIKYTEREKVRLTAEEEGFDEDEDEDAMSERLAHDEFLKDICYQSKKLQFYLYANLLKARNHQTEGEDDLLKKLGLYALNISENGHTLSTLMRQKPTLRAVEIEAIDPSAVARAFLNKM
ncbi:hypothetical protein G6F64_000192 [Rhizopus arrhizus]|uniref:CST complex subunit CTC1 n=1 Tax=Rhizopus oryzae TaxID=64495 RepID=A0A9P6XKM4_RHIOR|nr:hypothetical protein G6F64_000192 [Rhizopus arrhizus]